MDSPIPPSPPEPIRAPLNWSKSKDLAYFHREFGDEDMPPEAFLWKRVNGDQQALLVLLAVASLMLSRHHQEVDYWALRSLPTGVLTALFEKLIREHTTNEHQRLIVRKVMEQVNFSLRDCSRLAQSCIEHPHSVTLFELIQVSQWLYAAAHAANSLLWNLCCEEWETWLVHGAEEWLFPAGEWEHTANVLGTAPLGLFAGFTITSDSLREAECSGSRD